MAEAYVQVIGLPGLLAGLDALSPEINAANQKAMHASTLLVEADAKRRVPRRSGHLFGSIQSEVSGSGASLIGSVGTELAYAPYIEDGTRAHDIAPVTAGALMIPVALVGGFGGGTLTGRPRSGQQVALFAHVRHPGTRPHPFLEPALEENKGEIQRIFTAAADAVLAKIAAQARSTLALFKKL